HRALSAGNSGDAGWSSRANHALGSAGVADDTRRALSTPRAGRADRADARTTGRADRAGHAHRASHAVRAVQTYQTFLTPSAYGTSVAHTACRPLDAFRASCS